MLPLRDIAFWQNAQRYFGIIFSIVFYGKETVEDKSMFV